MQAPERVSTTVTRTPSPVVIGHRGAPAYRPEHTLACYELALDLGADRIEPDLVVSRDGVLVARHENELSLSTDIASRPEFAHLRTTREVDGVVRTGWFSEDLTLAELRTLRAVERTPDLRPLNTAYDGRYGLLTLADVVDLARRRSTPGRPVRVQAELKHPSWSAAHGMPVTELVTDELRRLDACRPDGPVVLQTFDAPALRALHTDLGDDGPELVQLVRNGPAGDQLVSPVGLRDVSTYAHGLGPSRDRLLGPAGSEAPVGDVGLVEAAHRAGLAVYPWALRPENAHLPRSLRRGTDPTAHGDAAAEARLLFALGCDGVITDAPETAVAARQALLATAA